MSDTSGAIETTSETSGSSPVSGTPGPASGTWVQLCTHTMANGATCGSPAVKGTNLCFHHSAVKTALGRVTPIDQVPYGIFSPIPFVFAEDAASLQINHQLLLQAVAEKRVDQRTGTLLFRILRSMAENLKNPLIAENPATHGEGDKINNLNGRIEADCPTTAPATSTSESAPQKPAATVSAPAPPKNVRPADDPALKAAIEALRPSSKENVNQILSQRDYLSDSELEYFSLPPYDKEENKPKPWIPDPLHPSVQRVLAMSCERP